MSLLQLLETIGSFQRAPATERARFSSAGSPYQPVLMLSLVRLFRRGDRRAAIVTYQECKDEFRILYERLFGPQDDATFAAKVVQPFWVFGSKRSIEPIWRLVAWDGLEQDLQIELETRKDPVKTESRLNELVAHSELPAEIFNLLRNETARAAIVSFTVSHHFPSPLEIVNTL